MDFRSPAPTRWSTLLLLTTIAACGVAPPAGAAATPPGRILYWAHLAETPDPAADCAGIAIVRVFTGPSQPAETGYWVLPLYPDHGPACNHAAGAAGSGRSTTHQPPEERRISNPTSCVQPLNCRTPGETGCDWLDNNQEFRRSLEQDALTRNKLDLYAEFTRRQHLDAEDGRWVDVRRLVEDLNATRAVDYAERRHRLALIQAFLTGEPVGEVSSESLKRAKAALHRAIAPALQNLATCHAAEARKGLVDAITALVMGSHDPVFQLGWVPAAVSRQVGHWAQYRTPEPRHASGLLTYYRLHLRQSARDEQDQWRWIGPFTALGPEPDNGCLERLRPVAEIDHPGQAAETRDCLLEVARLVRVEDPQQTIADHLTIIAGRIDHWRMPDEPHAPTATADGAYLGQLLAPSCPSRAAAFARGNHSVCTTWPWLRAVPPNPGPPGDWKASMVSDITHSTYPIYRDWFQNMDEAAWWESFRDELDRKRRLGDRFRADERSCYHHIPEQDGCISPFYYLALTAALLLLYLVYRMRHAVLSEGGGNPRPAEEAS